MVFQCKPNIYFFIFFFIFHDFYFDQTFFFLLKRETFSTSINLSNPNSNAFVDLDGDCFSDLALVTEECSNGECTKYLQVWIHDPENGKFVPPTDHIYALPKGVSQLTFADFGTFLFCFLFLFLFLLFIFIFIFIFTFYFYFILFYFFLFLLFHFLFSFF